MENKNMCNRCGGRCCKRCSGSYSGEQLDFTEILNELGKKYILVVDMVFNPNKVMMPPDMEFDMRKRWNIIRGYNREQAKKPLSFHFSIRPIGKYDNYKLSCIKTDEENECKFLGVNGCSLTYSDRPVVCSELRPNFVNGVDNCMDGIEPIQIYHTWEKYIETFEKILLEWVIEVCELNNGMLSMDGHKAFEKKYGYSESEFECLWLPFVENPNLIVSIKV